MSDKKINTRLFIYAAKEGITPYEELNGKKYLYIQAAQNRFMRFRTYIEEAFPETAERKGIIESEITKYETDSDLSLYIKDDTKLRLTGTVYDRGYVNAIFRLAEGIAQKNHILLPTDDYVCLTENLYRDTFSDYAVIYEEEDKINKLCEYVLNTLGFKRDADNILSLSPEDIFMGCAAAAFRLKVQIYKLKFDVTADTPLFVYLPYYSYTSSCGIIFGLKMLFGDNVRCYLYDNMDADTDITKNEYAVNHASNLISGIIKTDSKASSDLANCLTQISEELKIPQNANNILWLT